MEEFNTIGISLSWQAETQDGSMPTGQYHKLYFLTSIGDIGGDEESLEVTTLDNTWSVFMGSVKGDDGKLEVGAIFTAAFRASWENILAQHKRIWWKISIPEMEEAFYFAGEPSELGSPGLGVNEVFEGTVYITINEVAGWSEATAIPGNAIAGLAVAGWSPV